MMDPAEQHKVVRQALLAALEGRPAEGLALRESARRALKASFEDAKAAAGTLPASVVADAVAGALEGALLANGDAVRASVDVMHGVVEVAGDLNLDPEFVMRNALIGLAQVGRTSKQGTLVNIRQALDEAFLGLGEVFEGTCRDLAAGKAAA